MPERRKNVPLERKHRLTASAGSSGLGAVAALLVAKFWGAGLDPAEAALLGSAIGSATTTLALCFSDLRHLLWVAVAHRRPPKDVE